MLMINPGKCTSWGAEICRGCEKIVESWIRHGVHSCVFGFSDLVLAMQVVSCHSGSTSWWNHTMLNFTDPALLLSPAADYSSLLFGIHGVVIWS